METNPTGTVTVLSVSPRAQDYFSLQGHFSHSKWELYKADSIASAMAVVRTSEIAVVICERDLSPGTWIDMLEELMSLRYAPPLIVTSRLADDKLWAEALNLGAYDVLVKPFERTELVRSVHLAWSHWHHQHEASTRAVNTMTAAF
jgi:DNA-binding NtrC family response regulator